MQMSINVNESSIIDLRAELYRKEEQFKQNVTSEAGKSQEHKHSKGSKTLDKIAILSGKKKIPSKRKRDENKINDSSKSSSYKSSENDAEYEKAKYKLHAKAKLYDKMSKGDVEDPDDGDDPFYLVDFHKKVYGSDANAVNMQKDEYDSSGDELVEFEDSFGRSRRCRKRELEKLKSLDQEFRPVNRSPSPPTLLSEDMRRDMMRKKWEEEQEKLIREGDRDIHYQNVLFDEVRDHGVAYYQFSKDEAERKTQMDTLNLLREQTLEQRARRESIKQKRKAALDARLAKIRQKKAQKEGQSVTDDGESHENQSDSIEADRLAETEEGKTSSERLSVDNSKNDELRVDQRQEIGPHQPSNKDSTVSTSNTALKQLEESVNKHKGARESVSQWIKSMRKERNEEFAPPSFYYHEKGRR